MSVQLFAIDIDILGIPYFNKPVITTNNIIAEQRNLRITIPKGARLVHNYNAKEQPIYSITLVGAPFQENSNVKVYDHYESFYIKKESAN